MVQNSMDTHISYVDLNDQDMTPYFKITSSTYTNTVKAFEFVDMSTTTKPC